MNKKGITNGLEIILSFVIFIGFVFFLFLAFPIGGTNQSTVGLDSLERGLMNLTGSSVTYITIMANNSETIEHEKNCFKFDPRFEIDGGNILVRNESGDIIAAKYSDKKLYINETGKFYNIYISDEFIENSFEENEENPCQLLNQKDYQFGLTRIYNVLEYSKLLELNNSYNNRYTTLVGDFGLSAKENFGFTIREINGSIIMQNIRTRAEKLNNLVREVPIQIVYSDGTIKYAMLVIETW